MEYTGYREILLFFCCDTVSGSPEPLSILHSQNILMDVRCGSHTSDTDKQFILHAVVHPGQHYDLSILDASANCLTHFWTLGALGMHMMPMDMGFQVHSQNENCVFVNSFFTREVFTNGIELHCILKNTFILLNAPVFNP